MKFVLALVRLLGILLSICLFCAFLYFAFINQQGENAKMFSYGSLILFVFSTVITSLISVSFENYQNKKQNSAIFDKINDKLQEINTTPQTNTEPQEDRVTPFLEKLTTDGSNTAEAIHLGFEKITKQLASLQEANSAKNVNFGFESINNRLNEIQQASTSQTEQIFSSLSGITALPEQISALIANIGGTATGGNAPEIEVLQQTVSQIGEEMGQNNSQTIDTINKLKTDIADLQAKQQTAAAKLDDIITKLDYLLPVIQEMADNGISVSPATAAAIPVAEPAVKEEPVAVEPVAEPAVEEEPVAVEPIAEPATEEAPVVVESVAEPATEETPVAVEPVAEPATEETPVIVESVAEPVVEKAPSVPAPTETIDLAEFLAGTDETPMSLDGEDNSWTSGGVVPADHPEYEASDPFGVPAKHNISKLLPDIEGKTDPDTYASETPFGSSGQGSTEGLPDLPGPTNPAMLESDDPYGIPSDGPKPEAPIDRGELQADNPFGIAPTNADTASTDADTNPTDVNAPSGEDHSPLDAIFNEQFASDMADLDILKDDTDTTNATDNNFEEIDISAMFNDTQK